MSRIDSFEKLEMVLALHASPRKTMSVDELCRVLKLPRDSVRQAAIQLRAGSLVELTTTGEVQLLPPSSQDTDATDELVQSYNEDRVAVIKAMGEIAVDRIRNMASQVFADAFVLRKKPPEDGEDG